jgi:hypothetical protein
MPLLEHRVLEHNRNQDNGEPSAQPLAVELSPDIRADLLDPANWQEGLATFARTTNLAVVLVDAEGRPRGLRLAVADQPQSGRHDGDTVGDRLEHVAPTRHHPGIFEISSEFASGFSGNGISVIGSFFMERPVSVQKHSTESDHRFGPFRKTI